MKPAELDDIIFRIVSLFFQGATVSWANTKQTVNSFPHVTIRGGNVRRTTHAIKQNMDGVPYSSFPSNRLYEIQLYTSGKENKPPELQGIIVSVERKNTAVNDISGFLDYLESPEVLNIIHRNDISIATYSDAQDLSDYKDGVAVEYRAMVELSVDFTQTSSGAYGLRSHPITQDDDDQYTPNASGGGTAEMAAEETGYFTEVETEQTDF